MKLTLDTETGEIQKEPDTIYPILHYTNPFLRTKVKEFRFDEHNAVKLKNDFTATLKANPGFGLSAPQVGIDARFFVMLHENDFIFIANPEIIKSSEVTESDREGCLSDLFMMANVHRPKWIMVKYFNENQELIEKTFNDFDARVFLHEYEHLDGILFTDHIKPVALKLAREKQMKMKKKIDKMMKASRSRK